MRLRTDIITVDGKTTLAVIGGFDPSTRGKKIAHDAMVAHALVLAINDLEYFKQANAITDYADRLMREWGYDDE